MSLKVDTSSPVVTRRGRRKRDGGGDHCSLTQPRKAATVTLAVASSTGRQMRRLAGNWQKGVGHDESKDNGGGSSSSEAEIVPAIGGSNKNAPVRDGCRNGTERLESLPTEIIGAIMEYADIPSRLGLATCSRYFEDVIYTPGTRLWVEVDFGAVPTSHTARLSDPSLRRFLERINAREVTKVLSLRGCTGITLRGLDALRCSVVLEEIDLRVGDDHNVTFGETGLDNRAVLEVLSTMVPGPRCTRLHPVTFDTARLSIVKFRRQFEWRNRYESHSDDISNWLLDFNQQLKNRMKAKRSKCDHCNSVLTEKVPKEDLGSGYLCALCCRYLCCQGQCPLVCTCYDCMGEYCDDCRDTYVCDGCNGLFCIDCRQPEMCTVCLKSFCENCGDISCDDCYVHEE